MVTKADYGKREVEAARSVLVELIHLLGELRDAAVIVGGSVPPLLYPDIANNYVGTLDVDLALNHLAIDDETYQTIRTALLKRGYKEGKQPFIFFREVPTGDGHPVVVEVNFLSGEYGGTGRLHRTQKIQDVRARKARGCDLAFESYIVVEVEAELPEGGKDRVTCKVAAAVPFIVMKGMALADRMKEKDAWDIYFCITHHPGGIDRLVEEFRIYADHGLVREGLAKISEKFASPEHIGSKQVADFEAMTDSEERALLQRDVFERVNYLLEKLGI
ncbi:MAG TPA: hypothetical protein PK344_18060 [Syntrophorhabdaceae bacterium]|nr:hypothetical protein [Syntrophorhabdaceae bacterium]